MSMVVYPTTTLTGYGNQSQLNALTSILQVNEDVTGSWSTLIGDDETILQIVALLGAPNDLFR
jgi:hypothetical protein